MCPSPTTTLGHGWVCSAPSVLPAPVTRCPRVCPRTVLPEVASLIRSPPGMTFPSRVHLGFCILSSVLTVLHFVFFSFLLDCRFLEGRICLCSAFHPTQLYTQLDGSKILPSRLSEHFLFALQLGGRVTAWLKVSVSISHRVGSKWKRVQAHFLCQDVDSLRGALVRVTLACLPQLSRATTRCPCGTWRRVTEGLHSGPAVRPRCPSYR